MSPRRVIWVALLSDGLGAVTKFAVASFSGSAAMFSEGLHSLADTANQCLLLVGRTLSLHPLDAQHPFGYGKERFFWPFIVSLLIFSVGSVLSVVRGFEQIQNPRQLSHLRWNFLVLAVWRGGL